MGGSEVHALVVALALAVAAPALADYYVEHQVMGRRLVIKDKGPLARRIIVMTSATLAGIHDSTLTLFNATGGTDAVCIHIPLDGWTFPNRADIYRDRELTTSPLLFGFVSFTLDRVKLKFSSRNPAYSLDYTLDEPTQGAVALVIDTPSNLKGCFAGLSALQNPCQTDADCGGQPGTCQPIFLRTCAKFDGSAGSLLDEPGRFVAINAPALASCPVAPPC